MSKGLSEFDRVARQVQMVSVHALLLRAREAVVIGSSVSAARDGYPTSTPGSGNVGGGKGGRATMVITAVDDPSIGGDPDRVPTSSTEAAALAPPVQDPVARLAGRINRRVHQLARQLDELDRALCLFAVERSTARTPDPPMCWLAARYELPFDLRWQVGPDAVTKTTVTDFATVLARPLDRPEQVCAYTYNFVRNHRRLPTKAEMLGELQRAIGRPD